jgi:hypothetical protein
MKALKMDDMPHNTPTNMLGLVLTGFGLLYAHITASDLAAILTSILAIINIVIAWPKLKLRLAQIRVRMQRLFNKKNKTP